MKRVVYTVATIFLGLSCLFAGGVLEASASEPLVTDRPDITE